MDVALVRWPGEADKREDLTDKGVPRLLLLEDGVMPPAAPDCLEDWVRLGSGEGDVRARMATLESRVAVHRSQVPELDPDGVLRYGEKWVSLPPVESRLAAAMLDRYGAVVSRDGLAKAGWPTGTSGRNALDVHILRLRRRIQPISLVIRTVRSRGYLLEASE
jgi:hypothetical protein